MTPEQPNRGPADWVRQLALALDLPFMLIGAVMGGGLIGYVLDQWLHTEPWLMLIFGGLGLFAGMRAVLQSLSVRGRPTGGRGAIGPTEPRGGEKGEPESAGQDTGQEKK